MVAQVKHSPHRGAVRTQLNSLPSNTTPLASDEFIIQSMDETV